MRHFFFSEHRFGEHRLARFTMSGGPDRQLPNFDDLNAKNPDAADKGIKIDGPKDKPDATKDAIDFKKAANDLIDAGSKGAEKLAKMAKDGADAFTNQLRDAMKAGQDGLAKLPNVPSVDSIKNYLKSLPRPDFKKRDSAPDVRLGDSQFKLGKVGAKQDGPAGDKSADKPTDKPADKPVDKPADKPAEKVNDGQRADLITKYDALVDGISQGGQGAAETTYALDQINKLPVEMKKTLADMRGIDGNQDETFSGNGGVKVDISFDGNNFALKTQPDAKPADKPVDKSTDKPADATKPDNGEKKPEAKADKPAEKKNEKPAEAKGEKNEEKQEKKEDTKENKELTPEQARAKAVELTKEMVKTDPDLRSKLEGLRPGLASSETYDKMSPQDQRIMSSCDARITVRLAAAGMSENNIVHAKESIPFSPKGTLDFINEVLGTPAEGADKGSESKEKSPEDQLKDAIDKILGKDSALGKAIKELIDKHVADKGKDKGKDGPAKTPEKPEDQIRDKEAKIKANEGDIADIDGDLKKAGENGKKLGGQKKGVEQSLKELKADPKSSKADIRRMETQLRSVDKQIAVNEEEIKDLTDQRKELVDANTKLKTEIDDLKKTKPAEAKADASTEVKPAAPKEGELVQGAQKPGTPKEGEPVKADAKPATPTDGQPAKPAEAQPAANDKAPDKGAVDRLKTALGDAVKVNPDGSVKVDLGSTSYNPLVKMGMKASLDALKIPNEDGVVNVTNENIKFLTESAPQIMDFVNDLRDGKLSELTPDILSRVITSIDAQLPENMRGKLKLDGQNVLMFDIGNVAKRPLAVKGLNAIGLQVKGDKIAIEPKDIATAIAALKTASSFFPKRQEGQQ